jgi:hypothetical protein
LLLDDFRLALGKDMGVYDSVEGITRRIESILDGDGGQLRAPGEQEETGPLLVISGGREVEPYWEPIAKRFGFFLDRL